MNTSQTHSFSTAVRTITWICSLVVVGFLVGCHEQPKPVGEQKPSNSSTNIQTYEVKGEVKELKPNGKTVVVKHEAVPNYMPAMTMPFDVRNTNELRGLTPGDEIAFRMLVTADDGWIEGIRVLKSQRPSAPSMPVREATRRVRNVEPLSIGDVVPNYPFTNQFGKAVSLADFKGKAVALTFIFTRCPFPTFCPRMMSHFAEVQKALSARKDIPDWHLLSISFDTDYDTPETLQAYGERNGYDPKHWSLLTGALIEIDAITEQFGLMFPREGTNFAHNLRTVVLTPDGKVQKILISNEWKPAELIDEMIKAATSKSTTAAQ